MNKSQQFAFDRSARSTDANGNLRVLTSNISKAAINPYYGHEIPDWQSLGLQEKKVYRLFRDPEELKLGADTFAGLPILSKHVPISADAPKPELVIGALGSDIQFDEPYLTGDLTFWDGKAIAGIETKQVRELSCAYRYVPVMDGGEYKGQKYDGRMTQIQGNHLALVEHGRAGSDVVVADSNPFKLNKGNKMKMTKLGAAIAVAIGAAYPVLAADSAFAALVSQADKKSKKRILDGVLAMDTEIDTGKLGEIIDALTGLEEKSEEGEESPEIANDDDVASQIAALLDGKVEPEVIAQVVELAKPKATDELPEKEKDEKMKTAMDAFGAKLRAELKSADLARRDVRGVVGDCSLETAAEVYKFALAHMAVDHKGVEDEVALRALFKVAAKPVAKAVMAHDAAIADVDAQKYPALVAAMNKRNQGV